MLSKRGFKYDMIMLNNIFSIFRQRSASIFGFARNCSMLCYDVLCFGKKIITMEKFLDKVQETSK